MRSVAAQHHPERPAGPFDVGDRVVHPHHGAGEVVGRGRRRLYGSARDYLEIELAHASLRIMVPCDAAALIGLRPVVGRARMREIVDVLESEPEVVEASWSQRRKLYDATLKGGDVIALAAVIRDLARRATASELSSGERELYERSRRVLASELRYVLGVDAQRAAAYIDERVASPTVSDESHGSASARAAMLATPASPR
jgi:CarD family transcriptional regulator